LPAGVVELVGRDGELRALDADLAGPQPVIRLISGTAGVGKTALALHWAQRVRAEFPDGQLYVDLRGYDPEQPMLPAEALGRFLEALGADGALPLDPDLRAARFRTAIAGRRLLVVLDNAASHAQLRPLLPGGPGAMVIVTSRDSLGGLVALHAARRLDLGPLTEPDAVRLLGGLIGPRVAAEPAAASTLAELCARLPLALRVAAEYAVSWPEQPLADLVTDLTDRQRRLDLLDTGDARAAVREVISWSYHRLDPAAARAFRWLGLHPGPAFDGYALAALAGLELRPARRLLERLSRASLLQPAGRHRYGWHDLLRAYAAELAHTEESEVDCRAATGRLFDYYLAGTAAAARTLYPSQRGHLPDPPAAGIPPLATPAAAGAWLDAELANLSAACGHAAQHGWPEHAIGLAAHLHRYLEGGHHTDALAIYEAALTAARQAGDRRGEAHLRTNLGDIYRLLGQYQPATEQHHRALGLHRRTGDRSGQARTLSDLGIVAERCGSHSAAVRRYRHALRLYRELGDRYGEAAVLVNLGNVYSGQSRYAAAVEALGEAREIFGAIGERAGQAAALANLGEVYTTLRRYRQAADRLRDALAVFREIGHRDGEAAVLANLGLVDTRLGRTAEAIDFFQAALAIFRSTGHRYGQASAHNGLAEALAALGRTDQALAQHNQALAIASETGDRDEQVRAGKAIEQLTGAASASLQTPTSVR
jgi:tetratricopeptide (TPR) repeat protein